LCLIVLAWRVRPGLKLLVAANRDEWRERPAAPAHWWPDHPQIFAGRDLKARGTWMGVTRSGRFAAITNFRDPSDKRSTARSRGELVTGFLLSKEGAGAFLARVADRASDYNGFNLIAGDGESLWYFGSRAGVAREIPPGIHGLSNHVLDEPWPKVIRARAAMQDAVTQPDPSSDLFTMLSDRAVAPDDALPKTGVDPEWERRLSAPLITGEDYGTRCSTVIAVAAFGAINFEERTLAADGRVVDRRRETVRIEAAA
jgi:uncharacterized protein with NRDE domain